MPEQDAAQVHGRWEHAVAVGLDVLDVVPGDLGALGDLLDRDAARLAQLAEHLARPRGGVRSGGLSRGRGRRNERRRRGRGERGADRRRSTRGRGHLAIEPDGRSHRAPRLHHRRRSRQLHGPSVEGCSPNRDGRVVVPLLVVSPVLVLEEVFPIRRAGRERERGDDGGQRRRPRARRRVRLGSEPRVVACARGGVEQRRARLLEAGGEEVGVLRRHEGVGDDRARPVHLARPGISGLNLAGRGVRRDLEDLVEVLLRERRHFVAPGRTTSSASSPSAIPVNARAAGTSGRSTRSGRRARTARHISSS